MRFPPAVDPVRRQQHEGDPPQTARHGAQGHRQPIAVGDRRGGRSFISRFMPKASITSELRCSPNLISDPQGGISDSSDIVTISLDGKAVASVLNFYFRDEVLPIYGGGCALRGRLPPMISCIGRSCAEPASAAAASSISAEASVGYRIICVQAQLGIRADTARLSIPPDGGTQSARTEPAKSQARHT